MKELKVKVKNIQEQRPLKRCLSLPFMETRQGGKGTGSIRPCETPLPPILKGDPTPLPLIKMGRQRLAVQAQRINQLSTELEAAILELKAIANDLKREQRSNQSPEPIKSMCEYSAALVPCVRHKKSGVFVLTTRPVDLFQAEREATQVAQTLRRRAKKSRPVLSFPAQSNKQSK